MATKWAVANTAFTSAATWNDGVAPVDGDLCYLNGHTVTGTTGFNIGNGTISNDVCPNTGVGGGYISLTAGPMVITANVVCRGDRIILCSGNPHFTLNGNIDSKNTPYVIYRPTVTTTAHCTINGNIDSESQIFHNQSAAYNLTINGNAILKVTSYSRQVTNLTINGSLTLNDYVMNVLRDCSITGVLNSNYTNLICTNGIFTINGSINYKGNNIGVIANNFIVNNPDSFMWHDVTEPRSNPFIILTDAEMNNRQQYPSENEVKEGTEYVWGEMVGTYTPPPESVVLKDYEYDTITAEENDIATYNLTRYIYADYGTLHWFELKTTTTDIVTDPTLQSIDIDGDIVVADADYVVEYNDACYQWDGSAWGSITTNNIGTVKTDIVTNPTETTLCAKKGTLDVPSTQAIVTAINQSTIATNVNTLLQRLSDGLTQRLGQSVTIPILQQILDAHLN